LEVEVDAVFDGSDILIPGIFEHIERAGVHSGDSIAVYPPQRLDEYRSRRIAEVTSDVARELGIKGLINMQLVLHENELFILEANPRASRTVPIIQKATGVNIVAAATRVALGERLRDMPYGTGLVEAPSYVVVKVPVFSFSKMRGVETMLGPEMKSTGEVLGIDTTFPGALRKGFLGAGVRLPTRGGQILAAIASADREAAASVLALYASLGHDVVAPDGYTDALELIRRRGVELVIAPSGTNVRQASDDYKIRRAAVEAGIACLSSLDTARALAEALSATAGPPRSLQEYRRAPAAIEA
jgi:carbamoyl-phosphate synthase large subunit